MANHLNKFGFIAWFSDKVFSELPQLKNGCLQTCVC